MKDQIECPSELVQGANGFLDRGQKPCHIEGERDAEIAYITRKVAAASFQPAAIPSR